MRWRFLLLFLLATGLRACNLAASTETVVGTTHAWLTSLSPEGLRRHSIPTGLFAGRDPAWCGLPEIPPPPDLTKSVRVFFSCFPTGGPDLSEMIVAARTVDVPAGADPMRVALEALFAGPTEAERALGIGSFYGPETADFAFDVTVVDGNLAVVNLEPSAVTVVKGNLSIFVAAGDAFQIVETLGQFPGIERVAILIDGVHLCQAKQEC